MLMQGDQSAEAGRIKTIEQQRRAGSITRKVTVPARRDSGLRHSLARKLLN